MTKCFRRITFDFHAQALPPFSATSESITNEFDAELMGRFFRPCETPKRAADSDTQGRDARHMKADGDRWF